MKASELIKELQELIEKHGDLEIECYHHEEGNDYYDGIQFVDFNKEQLSFVIQ